MGEKFKKGRTSNYYLTQQRQQIRDKKYLVDWKIKSFRDDTESKVKRQV